MAQAAPFSFIDPHDAIFTQSSNASGSGQTDAYSSIDLSRAGNNALDTTPLPLTGAGLNDISQRGVHSFTFFATNSSNNQDGEIVSKTGGSMGAPVLS